MTLDQIDRMVRAANPVPDPTALGPAEASVLALDRRRPRRRVLIGTAAVALFVVVAIIVATVFMSPGRHARHVVTPARPDLSSTTTSVPPASERLNAFPPQGAIRSEPETGVLVADLPPVPLFVYEDRRVIFPLSIDGGWKNWFERRLTPEGLELVKTEIRSGGRLASVFPPARLPIVGWFDGDRDLITGAADPDWALLPASAWEDTEPKLFVPSRYLVCLRSAGTQGSPGVEPSALVARLPRAAAKPFTGAELPVRNPRTWPGSVCFDLATENARKVAVALDAARAGQPQIGNPFSYGTVNRRKPSKSVEIIFNAYLPHGNPVICCAG